MITKSLVTGLGTRLMGRMRKPQIPPQGDVPDPDSGMTSPTLLDRVRDWGDHPAWGRLLRALQSAIAPMVRPVRARCRRFG